MIAVTNTFLQGAGQDHIDGTFQGWAHFVFCIRSLVSWSLVSTTLVLAGSGALHSTQVYHPLEELCEPPSGQGRLCARTLPLCSRSVPALKVGWGFPRTEAGVGVEERCFIYLAIHALVSPLEMFLIKYNSFCI